MNFRHAFGGAVLLCAFLASGEAPMASVPELVTRMQAFYEKTEDFSARFRQEYRYASFKRTQTSNGTVTFKKPALMRWNYDSGKSFVLAGNKIYAFDPEARTLTKASMGSHALSASVTFLWGRGKLMDEFSISRKACEKCEGVLLEMVPKKPDARFQKIVLEVDPKTAAVRKSTVTDPDGSENAISFLDLKTNTRVTESFFRLAPPPDTTVQDLTAPPQK